MGPLLRRRRADHSGPFLVGLLARRRRMVLEASAAVNIIQHADMFTLGAFFLFCAAGLIGFFVLEMTKAILAFLKPPAPPAEIEPCEVKPPD